MQPLIIESGECNGSGQSNLCCNRTGKLPLSKNGIRHNTTIFLLSDDIARIDKKGLVTLSKRDPKSKIQCVVFIALMAVLTQVINGALFQRKAGTTLKSTRKTRIQIRFKLISTL